MNFGFRAEVGYNAAKDVTFLKTNTPDFTDQLTITVPRGSNEDAEIRALLEDQGIADFAELAKAPRLPDFLHGTFGLVGTEEDTNLSIHVHDQVVLFGKEGSGVVNLIRYWILNAVAHNFHVAAVGTPDDLYGMGKYINNNLLHFLNDEESLEEQVGEILDGYNRNLLILVGEGYDILDDEDAEFIKQVQNHEYNDEENIYTLIHHAPLYDNPLRVSFLGDEADEENVTYIAIGDVTDKTVKFLGDDIPARNPRGVAWVKQGADEATRVRTFFVPREFSKQLAGRVTYI
jgi:hypothetical protein